MRDNFTFSKRASLLSAFLYFISITGFSSSFAGKLVDSLIYNLVQSRVVCVGWCLVKMSNSNGSQDGDDFITKIALVNLPTGRTTLSGQTNNNQSCWEPNRSGVFQVSEAYKTIQQTEILHGTYRREFMKLSIFIFRIRNRFEKSDIFRIIKQERWTERPGNRS